jgi:hypothetical protein
MHTWNNKNLKNQGRKLVVEFGEGGIMQDINGCKQ